MFTTFPVTKAEDGCFDFVSVNGEPALAELGRALAAGILREPPLASEAEIAARAARILRAPAVPPGLPESFVQREPINRLKGTTPEKHRPKPAETK